MPTDHFLFLRDSIRVAFYVLVLLALLLAPESQPTILAFLIVNDAE